MNEQTLLPFMIATLASFSVLLALYGLRGLMGSKERATRLKDRVNRHAKGTRAKSSHQPEAKTSLQDSVRSKLNDIMSRVGERLAPKENEERSEANLALIRAGYRSQRAPLVLWGAKAGLMLAGLLIGLLIKLAAGDNIPAGMLALLFILPAVLGLYLPNMWLSSKVKSRRQEMENALPDALDLLVVCVEAGMGLDQAIGRVSKELAFSSPALAQELGIVVAELRAGKTRSESLKNLAHRAALEDLNSLVTLIIQADAFGTSVAHTLRVYSDTMRTARFQRAEEIAAKMPVKLLFPLVFCILPALFVAIMGPAGIRLMQVFAQME
ncbi:type II secretion system F family protein [Oleidesulfovibrio sp.]|uniref:type II secretion system F family protein n=1 Tax=Oleidesulfovibrio sp. TaxID=2909707 RepID=UPI003A838D1A